MMNEPQCVDLLGAIQARYLDEGIDHHLVQFGKERIEVERGPLILSLYCEEERLRMAITSERFHGTPCDFVDYMHAAKEIEKAVGVAKASCGGDE